MSEPWTRGPWLVAFNGNSWGDHEGGYWIISAGEHWVVRGSTEGKVHGKAPSCGVLNAADARLIEGAPEMAALLKRGIELVGLAEPDTDKALWDREWWVQQAHDLLSRVRGEPDAPQQRPMLLGE